MKIICDCGEELTFKEYELEEDDSDYRGFEGNLAVGNKSNIKMIAELIDEDMIYFYSCDGCGKRMWFY